MVRQIFSLASRSRTYKTVTNSVQISESIDFTNLSKWFEQEVVKIKLGGKNHTGLTVIRDGRQVFVKRYQISGIGHILGLLLTRQNKADHCFNISQKLRKLNIPVPEPLAVISDMSGRPPSFYYICAALPGFVTLRKISRNQINQNSDMPSLMSRIAELIARMHKSGIIHGDLKWPNIMIAPDLSFSIKFVDLDNTRPVRYPKSRLYALDLARFAVDMAENLPVSSLFSTFISTYSKKSGIKTEQIIMDMQPYYQKISSKHKKKYGHEVMSLNSLAEF